HRQDRIDLDCPPELIKKPDYPLRNKKILVAEDQQFNQTLLHTLLKTLGGKVDIAKDGLSALQSARTLDYDYIFMDIHMPKMDGIECTEKIRELSNHKTTVIVALTADVFFADQAVLKEMGFDACLYKPISEKKLRQTCMTHLNIKLSTTEKFKKDSPPNKKALAHIPSQLHFRLIEALLKQVEVTKSALHNETLFHTEMHKLKGLIDTFNLDTVKRHYEVLLTQKKTDNYKAMLHTFESIKTIVLSYAEH
ncbi:MAG: response regulator, partial [Gammaproteobacteria bacterium]|nr:response regulator [Gammaproteobacteria bacterium]